uniref:Uncharacterized protein n=1 Tax=Leersia perrieri TaxID=77586 RepID=A0A0D9V925_9ORYZ
MRNLHHRKRNLALLGHDFFLFLVVVVVFSSGAYVGVRGREGADKLVAPTPSIAKVAVSMAKTSHGMPFGCPLMLNFVGRTGW